MSRYRFGADAPPPAPMPVVAKPQVVVMPVAQPTVSHLLALPFKFALHTGGALVKWAGTTLDNLSNLLP